MSKGFEVGDRVVVQGFGLDRQALVARKVDRVTKRFVELNDGSRFSHRGTMYPARQFSCSFMFAATPALVAEARHQALVRRLRRVVWGDLDAETLNKVATIVGAPAKSRG